MSNPTGCMCCKAAGSSSRATKASRSSSSVAVTLSKTRLENLGVPMSAVVNFPVKPEARPYLDAFGRERGKSEPDWLAGYRKGSLARFAELGFPSRRSEAWRYIDLRPLEQRPMLPARSPKRASVRSSVRAGLAEISLAEPTHRVVLVDGRFSPELAAL